MPPRISPTVRQLRLGIELRKMRELAGMTPLDMAAAIGIDVSKVSQMEKGKSGISAERLRSWASAAKCTSTALVDALANQAQERGKRWFDEYRGRLPNGFVDIAEMEHYASGLVNWATTYVPGLLQTSAYASAVFSRIKPPLPRHELDTRTAFRIMRQQFAFDGRPYVAYLHEAALRMQFGGPAVLRAQLLSLLDESQRAGVHIRAIPFSVDTFPGLARISP